MIRYATSYRSNQRESRRLRIGPADSGRLMTLEDFRRAKEVPGYVYEIIDGVLIVSPNPIPLHDSWVSFVREELVKYSEKHPRQVDYVSDGAEVVIPGRPGATRPQPDVAAFRDFPDPPPAQWDDVCPILVVEVISERRAKKDTIRNRHLYWMAGGIMEYLIVDPRDDALKPTLVALVRKPGAVDWEEHVIPFGKSYKSKALPGFTLNLGRRGRK